jgi:hypothetical protein
MILTADIDCTLNTGDFVGARSARREVGSTTTVDLENLMLRSFRLSAVVVPLTAPAGL